MIKEQAIQALKNVKLIVEMIDREMQYEYIEYEYIELDTENEFELGYEAGVRDAYNDARKEIIYIIKQLEDEIDKIEHRNREIIEPSEGQLRLFADEANDEIPW